MIRRGMLIAFVHPLLAFAPLACAQLIEHPAVSCSIIDEFCEPESTYLLYCQTELRCGFDFGLGVDACQARLQQQYEDSSAVNDASGICDDVAQAHLAYHACMMDADCPVFREAATCQQEREALQEMLDAGGEPCLAGLAPHVIGEGEGEGEGEG